METVDASIPLQNKPNIPLMTPEQRLAYQQMLMKQQQQNALRNLLAQPGAFKGNALAPGYAQQLMATDPIGGAQIVGDMDAVDARRQAAEDAQRKRQMEARGFISKQLLPLWQKVQDDKAAGLGDAEIKRKYGEQYSSIFSDVANSGMFPKDSLDKYKEFNPSILDTAVLADDKADAQKEKLSQERADIEDKRSDAYISRQDALTKQGDRRLTIQEQSAAFNQKIKTAGLFSKEDAEFVADRVISGDPSAMIGIGRGAQGGENIRMVEQALRDRGDAEGLSKEETANMIKTNKGMYHAFVAQESSFGRTVAQNTFVAQKARNAIDNIKEADEKVGKTGFVPVNQLLQMYNSRTGNPDQQELAIRINSLSFEYTKALSGTGVATVDAMHHVDDMLSAVQTHEQLLRTLSTIDNELDFMQRAGWDTRQKLAKEFMAGKVPEEAAKKVGFDPKAEDAPSSSASSGAPPKPGASSAAPGAAKPASEYTDAEWDAAAKKYGFPSGRAAREAYERAHTSTAPATPAAQQPVAPVPSAQAANSPPVSIPTRVTGNAAGSIITRAQIAAIAKARGLPENAIVDNLRANGIPFEGE